MYVRTPRAFAWIDDQITAPTSDPFTGFHPAAPEPPLVRWARRPWPVPDGHCVALRKGLKGISVALRTPGQRMRWLPVGQVLTQDALRRWIEQGF